MPLSPIWFRERSSAASEAGRRRASSAQLRACRRTLDKRSSSSRAIDTSRDSFANPSSSLPPATARSKSTCSRSSLISRERYLPLAGTASDLNPKVVSERETSECVQARSFRKSTWSPSASARQQDEEDVCSAREEEDEKMVRARGRKAGERKEKRDMMAGRERERTSALGKRGTRRSMCSTLRRLHRSQTTHVSADPVPESMMMMR
eukprot:2667265-Rhodomonas_salina.1